MGRRRRILGSAPLDEFAAAHGLDRGGVLSATIYVTDLTEKPAMNRVCQEFFRPE